MIAPHTSMLLSYGIGAVCVVGAILGAVGYVLSPRFRRFIDRRGGE